MKQIRMFCCFVLVLLMSVSCSTEKLLNEAPNDPLSVTMQVAVSEDTVPVSDVQSQEAFEELNRQLLLLNEVYPTEIQERGRIWNWFKRIILGDVLGACLGACLTWNPVGSLLFGILGSVNGCLYEYNQPNSTTYVIEVPAVNPNFNSMSLTNVVNSGYVHNMVISDIFETCGDELYTMTDSELRSEIIEGLEHYMPITNALKTTFRSDITNKRILNDAIRNYGVISSEAILYNIQNTYPEVSSELQTLSIFCDHYSGLLNESTRDSYTSSFISTVNTSAISTNSKNLIVSSVSIANYSTKLWVEVQ